MNRLALLLVCAIFAGCANLKTSSQAAVGADAATTIIGVASGTAAEVNPLITSPAGLVASVALRLVIIDQIDKLPDTERVGSLAKFNALTWGIAASNLMILASASNPVGLVVGLMSGLAVWKSSEDERLFADACAYFRQLDAKIKCEFKSGT
jgi:hypothetical protein